MGCKITTSYVSANTLYWLVGMGLDAKGNWVTSNSQLPADIILDRTYIFGSNTTPIQHGIYANTQSFALVDSYCDAIVDGGADAQCIGVVEGTGPYLIQNNFLQATGENIMFGGSDPAIVNSVPSDITIMGNVFQKNTAWRGKIVDVKNFLELKNAQRLLIDGNVFQYDWAAGQSWPILFRSINQSGKCTWCVVQDVTFTHNLLQHVPNGIEASAMDPSLSPALPTARILVRNNLLTDVSGANWGSQGSSFFVSSNATYVIHDVIIDHNTTFSDGKGLSLGDTGHVISLQFSNNLVAYGTYAVFGSGAGTGTAVFTTFSPDYVYGQNAFIRNTGSQSGAYPSGTLWATLSGAEFTSITGAAPNYSGNFQLSSNSPYHNAGTDGKDIGVWDWQCLNKDISAAQAGTFVPSTQGCGAIANSKATSGTSSPIQAPTNLNAIVH